MYQKLLILILLSAPYANGSDHAITPAGGDGSAESKGQTVSTAMSYEKACFLAQKAVAKARSINVHETFASLYLCNDQMEEIKNAQTRSTTKTAALNDFIAKHDTLDQKLFWRCLACKRAERYKVTLEQLIKTEEGFKLDDKSKILDDKSMKILFAIDKKSNNLTNDLIKKLSARNNSDRKTKQTIFRFASNYSALWAMHVKGHELNNYRWSQKMPIAITAPTPAPSPEPSSADSSEILDLTSLMASTSITGEAAEGGKIRKKPGAHLSKIAKPY